MHNHSLEYKKLLYHYEILQARLDIRDFFLKTAVREVYENIGQVLSLVRMQLSFVNKDAGESPSESMPHPGELVSQSIRDLRSMCRIFYPDSDIIKPGGFKAGIQHAINILHQVHPSTFEFSARSEEISPGLLLIYFNLMLDILHSVNEAEGKLKKVKLAFKQKTMLATITYEGKDIEATWYDKEKIEGESSFAERLELTRSTVLCTKRSKECIIKLQSPLTLADYE